LRRHPPWPCDFELVNTFIEDIQICGVVLVSLQADPMSLPPERISIKRRRQDEPVETLCADAFVACPSIVSLTIDRP